MAFPGARPAIASCRLEKTCLFLYLAGPLPSTSVHPHDEVFALSNHADDQCGREEWFDYLMSWVSQAFIWRVARRQDDTVSQVTTPKLRECGLRMVRLPDAACRRSVPWSVDRSF